MSNCKNCHVLSSRDLNKVVHWISYWYRKISSFLISPYWSNTTIGCNLTVQSDTLCKLSTHNTITCTHSLFCTTRTVCMHACTQCNTLKFLCGCVCLSVCLHVSNRSQGLGGRTRLLLHVTLILRTL